MIKFEIKIIPIVKGKELWGKPIRSYSVYFQNLIECDLTAKQLISENETYYIIQVSS